MSLSARHFRFVIAAVLLLLLLVLLASQLFSDSNIDPDQLAQRVASLPPLWLFVYFLVAVGFTTIGLPRQLVAFVCGFVFGLTWGVLISLLASIFGCMLAYAASARVLAPFLRKRYQSAANGLDAFVRDDAFFKIIVLRLQPLGTNLLTNLAAGISNIRARTFFLASAIGYLPQLIVFALAGDGIRLGDQSRLLVSGSLLVFSLLLAAWLWRRHLKRTNASQ